VTIVFCAMVAPPDVRPLLQAHSHRIASMPVLESGRA
jgi:hypothetical protein